LTYQGKYKNIIIPSEKPFRTVSRVKAGDGGKDGDSHENTSGNQKDCCITGAGHWGARVRHQKSLYGMFEDDWVLLEMKRLIKQMEYRGL